MIPGRASADTSPRAVTTNATTEVTRAAPKAKDHSRDCANKARKQAKKNEKYKYWVCLGTKVKYLKKKKPKRASAAVGEDGAFTGSGPKTATSKIVAQNIFSDDRRCELVPACTTIRTLYTADIKANALYGYRDQIWGSFDVVFVQSFNGASSRYRLTLIWDSGYEVDSQYWRAAVRRNVRGLPDPTRSSARPRFICPTVIAPRGNASTTALLDLSDGV